MEKEFNDLIENIKKCEICKDKFGFQPHPIFLEYINNKIYIIIGAKSAKVFFPKENFNELIFKDNYINGKPAIVLPHPSPLNIKWFKDHPNFMNKRILEIRKIINDVLEEE